MTSEKERMGAKEIEKFRKSQNMSIEVFAEFIGVTPQAVILWERGQRQLPVPMVRLFRLLGKFPQLVKEYGARANQLKGEGE